MSKKFILSYIKGELDAANKRRMDMLFNRTDEVKAVKKLAESFEGGYMTLYNLYYEGGINAVKRYILQKKNEDLRVDMIVKDILENK